MRNVGEKHTNKDVDLFNRKVSRRTLFGGAVAAASIALVKSVSGQLVSAIVPDPTKVPGTPPGSIGTRSASEYLAKLPSDTSSRTPLQSLYGTITPSDLHFERSHNGVPQIDPNKYELLIHGMVDKRMVFTLHDLKRFPSLSRIAFLECSGNF